MRVKGRSLFFVALAVVAAAGLAVLSYFGIGPEHTLGVGGIRQGLDLRGGVSIVYTAKDYNPNQTEMNAAISLIRRRLDSKNYTEAEVGQQGSDQIRADIPGAGDAEQAVRELGATALLTFKDEAGNTLLTGSDVSDAKRQYMSASQGTAGQYVVSLSFNSDGVKKFADATAANLNKTISIFLDNEMISSPTVNAAITDGNAIIESSTFTAESSEMLARTIREGSLPFALEVLSVNNVGATLGVNALNTGIIAGVIGAGFVLVFMLVIYRMSGLAADIALVIYVGIVLLLLSLFSITLTLPGIAGIILSIGMAVDANVIIFERMREEISSGRSIHASIDASFRRAFPAILDSNVTTLIAAAVLFWLGTGPIKGFAQTLAIGIVVSMFTALTVTRFILKNLAGAGLNVPKMFIPVKKEA
ncbi:MAG: protein translocase subunit SecD [Clostridiales bacterium]|jgi:protein-export SecD/SecF family membrane protein|nr:protein translocase subunit SecD [Clostridiales bacterium]